MTTSQLAAKLSTEFGNNKDTGGWSLSEAAVELLLNRLAGGAGGGLPPYDYQAFSYIGSTNNVASIVYKTGGAAGTTVATQTFTYVGAGAANDDQVASITRT